MNKKTIFGLFAICGIVILCCGILLAKETSISSELCDHYSNQDKTEIRFLGSGEKQIKINSNWYDEKEVFNSCLGIS